MTNTEPVSNIPLPQGLALQDLLSIAIDWTLLNGACMRSKEKFSSESVVFVPFTLFPTPFPKEEFEKAKKIQPVLNELVNAVAYDHEFLRSTLINTVEVDEFTRKLFDIYETVREEGFVPSYSMGLFRSDYMINDTEQNLNIKQVEINTIATSLAGLAPQIDLLHKFVFERLKRFKDLSKLPENNALNGLCRGLIRGWELYNNPNAAILVIVENVVYNICDQRAQEFQIYRINPKVTILRRTLSEVAKRGFLDAEKKLFVDGIEVAVVYYRSGYSPVQYHNDVEWQARLQMERSKALKCPSIQYHLAGTKKVQQAIASKNILSMFLMDPQKVEMVLKIFTGLYSLDLDSEGEKTIQMAVQRPQDFVLKPQREGGGNNFYGDDIVKVLSEIGHSKERSAYILMDRIQPPVFKNYIIRPSALESISEQDVVSELGIYGVIIGKKDEILVNEQVGHMLRTKDRSANEGGVAAGVGSLDSPLLY